MTTPHCEHTPYFDELIHNGERTRLVSVPTLPHNHPRIVGGNTIIVCSDNPGRYYFSTWEIKAGRLYLVDLRAGKQLLGSEPLFADWFTGVLKIPHGEVFRTARFSIVHQAIHITVEQGVVGDSQVVDQNWLF